jgi:OOP family OmpA-OmpF porin
MRAQIAVVAAAFLLCSSARSVLAEEGKPAPAKVTEAKGQLKVHAGVFFAVGSDKLTPASESALAGLAKYLAENSEVTKLRIEVHSDARGSSGYNMAMSKKRAMSVARWLVAHKVSCRRLLPVGFGESQPLAPSSTAAGRDKNRRISYFHAAIGQTLAFPGHSS